jgi:sodium-dependent dicarboxylate transporter 2/3/5
MPADDVSEGSSAEQPSASPSSALGGGLGDSGPGDGPLGVRQWAGLVGGPLVLAIMLLSPAPAGLEPAGWHTAAMGLLMAIWWITEALPIPVTALVPLVLVPLLGAGTMEAAATPYANPLIALFLGGFVIALGMERWNLHRRIALTIIRAVGTRPRRIIAGFMVASAFLSMWVSNTATAMMMLPIGLSVVQLARRSRATDGDAPAEDAVRPFAVALMLSIAYACSVGGLGTLIGTPPNTLLAGFFSETYGVDIGFAQWMQVGLPLVLVGLPLTYVVLTRVVFSVDLKTLAGGRALIDRELEKMGVPSRAEIVVGTVFVAVAALWITRPLLDPYIPGLSDAGIAMAGALLLFVTPVAPSEGTFVLDWSDAQQLPWGVLILFGGGLSLAAAVERTGLAAWIGEALSGLGGLPVVLVVLLVAATVIALTELTSNTATAAAFLPIMGSVAVGIGQNPFLLAVPAALAASCAFMLPVATPPNAIIYGSGALRVPEMARAGIVLNMLFAALITAFAYTLILTVFGVDLGAVPAWATGG